MFYISLTESRSSCHSAILSTTNPQHKRSLSIAIVDNPAKFYDNSLKPFHIMLGSMNKQADGDEHITSLADVTTAIEITHVGIVHVYKIFSAELQL